MNKAALFAASAFLITASPTGSHAAKPDPIKVDLYVMSQCPFGTQAENVMIPAVKSLGANAVLNLYFIANELPPIAGLDNNKPAKPAFKSMHGPEEVQEDIRHVCALKNFPKQALDFILARNANIRDPNWQNAAGKTGINPAKLEACVNGDEGAVLLSESIRKSMARGAQSSPTIDINGSPYMGARGLRSFTLAICGAISAKGVPLPAACEKAKDLPADPMPGGGAGCGEAGGQQAQKIVPFDVQVVADKSCEFCSPTLIQAIKEQHPGASIKTIDAASEEGRSLIKKFDARALPVYFLDKKVEEDQNFGRMSAYYQKVEGGYVMRAGPDTFVPSVQLDRKPLARHLDVFVESLSPFNPQMEHELLQLLTQSSDIPDLTFSMHFIVQETAKADHAAAAGGASAAGVRSASIKEMSSASVGPLTSRRGEDELQESMRQVCLFQHASMGTFFTYLNCRYQNMQDKTRGDVCLQMTEELRKCLQGPEAERLLRQDARLAQELNVAAGPSVLWENRYGPFGWHEVNWKSVLEAKKK